DLLSDTLQSDILAQLPLIGDSFVSGGEYLGQFNEKFVNPIVSKIEDLIDGANDSKEVVETALKKIIFDTLGQGLDDIDVITGPGMDILWLADGSAKVTSFEEVDVQVNVADGETLLSDPNAEVIVNLRLKALDTLEANFDLGLDGFGLVGVAASGGVEVGVDFDIQVGFGINKSDGFFLNLPAT